MLTPELHRKRAWEIVSGLVLILVVAGTGSAYLRYQAVNRALARAIEHSDWERAGALLKQGADPHTRSHDGANLLILAARTNDVALLKEGLARGIEVEAADFHGVTPLVWASLCGWEESAAVLLKAGAAPRRRSPDGLTPLNSTDIRGVTQWEGTRLTFALHRTRTVEFTVRPRGKPALPY